MIGGKTINDIQIFPQCLHVLSGAQHGPHLSPAITKNRHIVFTQEEVMRCDLACHLNAFLLCSSDDKDLKREKKKHETFPHVRQINTKSDTNTWLLEKVCILTSSFLAIWQM